MIFPNTLVYINVLLLILYHLHPMMSHVQYTFINRVLLQLWEQWLINEQLKFLMNSYKRQLVFLPIEPQSCNNNIVNFKFFSSLLNYGFLSFAQYLDIYLLGLQGASRQFTFSIVNIFLCVHCKIKAKKSSRILKPKFCGFFKFNDNN